MATACAVAAAVFWLLVWLHQYRSHGRTTVNEMRLVLGLTWMDAAKILPFGYLLLLPGLEVLVARTTTRASRVVARVAQACLVVAAVAGAVDFWTFPTGSYALTFESRGNDGAPVQFLGSVLAGLALATWAVLRRRATYLEWALLVVLASGAVVSSLWTSVLLWPAVAWLGFGVWLWLSGARSRSIVPAASQMRR